LSFDLYQPLFPLLAFNLRDRPSEVYVLWHILPTYCTVVLVYTNVVSDRCKSDASTRRSVMHNSCQDWRTELCVLESVFLYCTTAVLMDTSDENLPYFHAVVWDSRKEIANSNNKSHTSICNIW
jgi:hypothetical protein